MRLNKMCLSGLFGLAIVAIACGAATTVVSQPFATATDDLTTITGAQAGSWSGNGAVTNIAVTQNISVGKPIGGSDTGVLAVEGKVTCKGASDAALSSGSTPTSVDMLIQIAKPDDALEALDDATVKFAVGVENDGSIKVYCGSKSGNGNAWRPLITTAQEEGSWHRVSLRFNYSAGLCEVAYDGNPVVTQYGWLTTAKAGDANGSWYPLVSSSTGLASVQVVGTTAIDEVLVKTGTDEEVSPEPAGVVDKGGVEIPRSWFVQNGISATPDTAPDGSGMSIKDKYLTGVSPTSGEKFEIKSMSMAKVDSAAKATLVVPAMTPALGSSNVIITRNASGAQVGEPKTIESGDTSVVVDAPALNDGKANVYTYELKNQKNQ